jgi:hypothetical protein
VTWSVGPEFKCWYCKKNPKKVGGNTQYLSIVKKNLLIGIFFQYNHMGGVYYILYIYIYIYHCILHSIHDLKNILLKETRNKRRYTVQLSFHKFSNQAQIIYSDRSLDISVLAPLQVLMTKKHNVGCFWNDVKNL